MHTHTQQHTHMDYITTSRIALHTPHVPMYTYSHVYKQYTKLRTLHHAHHTQVHMHTLHTTIIAIIFVLGHCVHLKVVRACSNARCYRNFMHNISSRKLYYDMCALLSCYRVSQYPVLNCCVMIMVYMFLKKHTHTPMHVQHTDKKKHKPHRVNYSIVIMSSLKC